MLRFLSRLLTGCVFELDIFIQGEVCFQSSKIMFAHTSNQSISTVGAKLLEFKHYFSVTKVGGIVGLFRLFMLLEM